jgi:hypothetical protein
MSTDTKPTVELDNGQITPPHDVEKSAVLDERFRNLPPDPDEGASDEERARIDKKLVRKLDLKLIPWLSLLYLLSFLDRK